MSEAEDLRRAVARLAGRVAAQDFVLSMLIALHPNRKYLKHCWDNWLPTCIDSWMEQPPYEGNAEVREGVHEQLRALTPYLDVPVDAGEDE